MEETGLTRLTRAAFDMLNLITYFTAGAKESRAWTISRGVTARQAAGVIHKDFERGFIRAEVIGWRDFIEHGRGKRSQRERQTSFGRARLCRRRRRCDSFSL